MKMPRIRSTVRGLMVAVAVVGLASGALILLARRQAYLRQAASLRQRAFFARSMSPGWGAADDLERLAAEYERAARYPWLAVTHAAPEPRYRKVSIVKKVDHMAEATRRRLSGPLLWTTLALTAAVAAVRVLVAVGRWWSPEYESLEQLPPSVLAAVREAAPGYEPESISSIKYDGEDAFRLECRDRSGSTCQVEISRRGQVLWVHRP